MAVIVVFAPMLAILDVDVVFERRVAPLAANVLASPTFAIGAVVAAFRTPRLTFLDVEVLLLGRFALARARVDPTRNG